MITDTSRVRLTIEALHVSGVTHVVDVPALHAKFAALLKFLPIRVRKWGRRGEKRRVRSRRERARGGGVFSYSKVSRHQLS